MASETTSVSDHPAPSQEIEKELQSQVKDKVKPEINDSVLKETAASDPDSDGKPKPEETAQVAAAPVVEVKMVDRPIEPAAAEELKTAEDKPAEPQPLEGSTGKPEDKPIEAPPTPAELQKETQVAHELAVQKIEGVKTVEPALVQEGKKIEDVLIAEAPDEEVVKGEMPSDGKSGEKTETEQVEELKAEASEGKPRELAKESEPEPAGQPVEELKADMVEVKPQELEKIAEPGNEKEEAIEARDVAVSDAVCEPEDSAPVAPSVETKSPEVVKQVDEQPPETLPVVKDEDKSSLQEVENVIKLSKVDGTGAAEGSDQVKSESIEVKGALEKKVEVEAESEVKPEEKSEAKSDVKPEEKSVVAEELVQSDQKPAEGVTTSAPPPEEKSTEAEVISRDIEQLVVDNGNKKEEASGETTKEAKQVDEPAKTDMKDSECNKDSKETKTGQEEGKGDVLTKPRKPSLVKMVKQSLVKAKKAIIGKSHQNTKTPAATEQQKDQGNK